jgi:small subunit ribosomal protein S13
MAKARKEAQPEVDEDFNFIVRIAASDIDGHKRTVIGLQSIRGVGKRVAQIIVRKADLAPSVKIGTLSDEKVKELATQVTTYVEYVPRWGGTRQMDYETGADMHILGNELELVQKDDINRMKMIRCYRGIRHETRHKVRGQRTRSNGRKGLTMGVQRKSSGSK